MERKKPDPFNENNGQFRVQTLNKFETKIVLAAMRKMNCSNRSVFNKMALLTQSKLILGYEQ